MSRIGLKPITLPAGTTCEVVGNKVVVSGKLGKLEQEIKPQIKVKVENNVVTLSRVNETKDVKALHGLYRALINNMVKGVTEGWTKKLTINGVGYKVTKQGNKLVMNLGLSHPVEVVEIDGIKLDINPANANEVIVSGADKEKVGGVAAKIRELKPVEPYHLYGIRYSDEVVIKKEGKTVAGKK